MYSGMVIISYSYRKFISYYRLFYLRRSSDVRQDLEIMLFKDVAKGSPYGDSRRNAQFDGVCRTSVHPVHQQRF